MHQLIERLQHFQRRYRTQLSRSDQEWLHHTQQQIAFDLARLAHLADSSSVAPDATEPPLSPRKVEPIAQLMEQIVRLAQNTTEMVQTALSPQQKAGTQDLDATGARPPQPATGGDGATVDAILILLGKNDRVEPDQEALDGTARDPSTAHSGPLADPRGDATVVHTYHRPNEASMSPSPQDPAFGLPHDADAASPVLRAQKMVLEEQIKALRRLRPKGAGSAGKRHRARRSEL
jgi:hypothetical protein